jgi:nucleoside-diphosphate-sugar epimerase
MALLITGGTGFIGSYVTHYAAKMRPDERIIVADRYPVAARIAGLDNVTVVDTDTSQVPEMIEVMQDNEVDRVIHLAFAVGGVRPNRILQYAQAQAVGSLGVFEAARIAGVKRVIGASSVAVYGSRAGDGSLTEDDPVTPGDAYGATKAWLENMATIYIDMHGMEIAHLRISASMGSGRLARASLSAGITSERLNWMASPEWAVAGQPITLPPRAQVVDFIYAVDTAAAFYLAAYAPKLGYRIYNLTGEHLTSGEFGDALQRALPSAKIAYEDDEVRARPSMSNDRLMSDLGFKPQYSLDEGIAEYIQMTRDLHAKQSA